MNPPFQKFWVRPWQPQTLRHQYRSHFATMCPEKSILDDFSVEVSSCIIYVVTLSNDSSACLLALRTWEYCQEQGRKTLSCWSPPKNCELRDIWPSYFSFQRSWSDCADEKACLRICCSQATSQCFLPRGLYDVETQASWPPPGYAPEDKQFLNAPASIKRVSVGSWVQITTPCVQRFKVYALYAIKNIFKSWRLIANFNSTKSPRYLYNTSKSTYLTMFTLSRNFKQHCKNVFRFFSSGSRDYMTTLCQHVSTLIRRHYEARRSRSVDCLHADLLMKWTLALFLNHNDRVSACIHLLFAASHLFPAAVWTLDAELHDCKITDHRVTAASSATWSGT